MFLGLLYFDEFYRTGIKIVFLCIYSHYNHTSRHQQTAVIYHFILLPGNCIVTEFPQGINYNLCYFVHRIRIFCFFNYRRIHYHCNGT